MASIMTRLQQSNHWQVQHHRMRLAQRRTPPPRRSNPEAVGGAEQWDEDRESQAFLQEFAALEKQVIAPQVANSDPNLAHRIG